MSLESAKVSAREAAKRHAEKVLLTKVANERAKQLCKEFAQQAQSVPSLPIYTRIKSTKRLKFSKLVETQVGNGWPFTYMYCPNDLGFLTITTDGVPVSVEVRTMTSELLTWSGDHRYFGPLLEASWENKVHLCTDDGVPLLLSSGSDFYVPLEKVLGLWLVEHNL